MPFSKCATRICWLICILWLVSCIINPFPSFRQDGRATVQDAGEFSRLRIFLISLLPIKGQCTLMPAGLLVWQKGKDLGNKAICPPLLLLLQMHHPKRQKIRRPSQIFKVFCSAQLPEEEKSDIHWLLQLSVETNYWPSYFPDTIVLLGSPTNK